MIFVSGLRTFTRFITPSQTVLQSRDGPVMSRMAMLLGLMGIGMSGYSSRQLTLHCKPSLLLPPPCQPINKPRARPANVDSISFK
uniref:Uncharacterized protein n=1 Tax=Acanthochromis polyacanthus TaxID=80966 RepID=A0A3Q1HXX5_9TELE